MFAVVCSEYCLDLGNVVESEVFYFQERCDDVLKRSQCTWRGQRPMEITPHSFVVSSTTTDH